MLNKLGLNLPNEIISKLKNKNEYPLGINLPKLIYLMKKKVILIDQKFNRFLKLLLQNQYYKFLNLSYFLRMNFLSVQLSHHL